MHILSRGLNPYFSFTSVSMNVKDRSKCLILSSLSDALLRRGHGPDVSHIFYQYSNHE